MGPWPGPESSFPPPLWSQQAATPRSYGPTVLPRALSGGLQDLMTPGDQGSRVHRSRGGDNHCVLMIYRPRQRRARPSWWGSSSRGGPDPAGEVSILGDGRESWHPTSPPLGTAISPGILHRQAGMMNRGQAGSGLHRSQPPHSSPQSP